MSTNGISNGHNTKSNGFLFQQPPQRAQSTRTIGIQSTVPSGRTIPADPTLPAWCVQMVVTPEQASIWLEFNTLNRPVSRDNVRKLARDIKAGRWGVNVHGPVFGTNRALLDGQHRLMAVVEAGIAVPMFVWFNAPPEARQNMDLGKRRSVSDITGISKEKAAVAAMLMKGITGRPLVETASEQGSFYYVHQQNIDAVVAQFAAIRKGITQASVQAPIVAASYHLDWRDILEFCDVLKSGISQRARDVVVIKLRDRLLGLRSPGGGARQAEIYALTAAALRHFADGKLVRSLVGARTDPFPLPVVE